MLKGDPICATGGQGNLRSRGAQVSVRDHGRLRIIKGLSLSSLLDVTGARALMFDGPV